MSNRYLHDADALWPLIEPKVRKIVTAGALAGGASSGGGGVSEHDLGGSLHKGPLRDDQGPQFLLVDGSRALTGNLLVSAGVTIDGVDLSVHAADPDAHHARQHGILSTADHTVTGAAWQTVGLTAANTLGLLTPSSDVTGATKEALLKSNASGYLSLVRLTVSERLRGPLLDTASGSLTVKPANELILDPDGGAVRLTSGKLIKSTGFTSGFTGAGWQIDDGVISAGRTSAEVDDLTVRGRMRIYELLIQQIRATNGSLFVTSGSKVVTVAAVSPAWTVTGGALTFNGSPATLSASFYTVSTAAVGDTDRSLYHGFLYGDLPVAQQVAWNGTAFAGVMQSKLEVTRVDSLTQYGAVLVSGNAPEVGFDYVRRGNTVDASRRGAIYLTSDDSAAPYIDVVDGLRYHSDWNQVGNVKVRMGRLTGITGQADAYGIFSGDNSRAWISSEAINGFRIGYAGATRLQADMAGTLRLLNSAEEPVITLDGTGASYFAGVMTIGVAGEIRQGTGALGDDYTGLRIWRDGDIGRIGGYNDGDLQWYADTGGEMRAGGGVVALAIDGLGMARYTTDAGTPIAGTEADAALAWWDDIDARTGAPLARIYGARSSAGTGAVPSLSIEVDPSNADANSRPSIWLIGKSAQPTQIWFNDIDTFVGIPGLVPSRNPTTRAESVAFSGLLTFKGHLLRDPANADIDIGASGTPFRTLYVGSIVADTITGSTSIGGAVWQNDAANMYIRSNSASSRTLYVANDGAGVMGLNVEGDIALGGTVDGVDVAAFYSAYGAHTHSHSALTGIGANDHHNQQHAYDSADHTGTLSWAKVSKTGASLADLPTRNYADLASRGHALDGADHTASGLTAGWVLRASGATTFAWAQLAHSDLSGLTVGDPHTQYALRARQVIAGAGMTGGGDLSVDRTLALTTPGTLAVATTNNASGSHTHAVTSSADPDNSAALLSTTSAGLLTLRDLAARQAVQSQAAFISGFAGTGWRVDYGVTTAGKASAEFDNLTVRGQMRIYELLIQQIRATNGSLFVTSGSRVVTATATGNAWMVTGGALTLNGSPATFAASFYTVTTAAAGDTGETDRALYHGFLYGDLPAAQQTRWNGSAFAGVTVSKIEVTRVDSLTRYGAVLVEGSAPAAGLDYVRRGNTVDPNRRGAIYLTSDDAAAPFIDILDGLTYHADWGSAAVNRVRLGELAGITDADFGGTLSGYGLYANRAYIKGTVVVTGGSLGGLAAADVNANTTTIDGGRITALSVTASQIATGTITAGQIAAGTITAGQIAAGTITATQIAASAITGDKLSLSSYLAINSDTWGADGVQLQYNGGNPRAYIGNGSNRYFQFDGTNISWQGANTSLSAAGLFTATNAEIEGEIIAGSGSVGGWTIGASALSSTNIALYSGAANAARLEVGSSTFAAGVNSPASQYDVAFWAGSTHAGRVGAKFTVTAGGVLSATGAVIGGQINIDGGTVAGPLYAGTNAIRLSTDGERLVLPDTTGLEVPTSSSAIRWIPSIDGTHDYTKNYTGLVGYRHTGVTAVDMLHTVFVGSTDAATYDARLILQAGHQTGSDAATTYTSSMLIVTREKGSGRRTVNALCDVFTTSAAAYVGGALRVLAQSSNPAIGGSGEGVNIYAKGDKLIFAYNQGGTVRYKYITMSGEGLGWSYSATAP